MGDISFDIRDILWIGGALLAAVLLAILLLRFAKKYVNSFKEIEWKEFRKIREPLLFIFLLSALSIVFPMIGLDQEWTPTFRHVSSILFTVAIAWLVIDGVAILRYFIVKQYDLQKENNLRARKVYTQFKVFERIIVFVVIILAIGIILMTFDRIRQIGISLLASAGIAGIILGFAAQRIIATVLAGFQIAITQPIRIDDVVIVENEWGWIEEIALTYVVVRIWDKRRLIVPTTYFIEKPFQNWTRTNSEILGTVFIYADYSVPTEAVRHALTQILESSALWDKQVNVLQVTNATERTIELRALMSAKDSSSAWDLRVHVREKLIQFLQENYPESLPKVRLAKEVNDQPS